MFEIFQISWTVLKENWKSFSFLLLVSLAIAIYNYSNTELVYEAEYVGAPYYETASDVAYKVKELKVAINDNDQAYINRYVSDSLNVYELTNAIVKKESKGADYTFKHIKVKLKVDVLDSTNLDLWDRQLHQFYIRSSNIEGNQYRGREVLIERLEELSKQHYGYDVSARNKTDNLLRLLKIDLQRDKMVLTDSNMVDILFARYIAEYRNSMGVNKINSLVSSHHLKEEQVAKLWTFIYTFLGPAFLVLFFWSSYIDYSQNRK